MKWASYHIVGIIGSVGVTLAYHFGGSPETFAEAFKYYRDRTWQIFVSDPEIAKGLLLLVILECHTCDYPELEEFLLR